jgi:5-amino-6-(5-phosphoribosylamino)uracil reductase
MPDRPYTVLSWAMSLDGYLDDTTRHRLVVSNEEDLDRVDAVRAACDAVLVGAETVRRDDPRLVVRRPARRARRAAAGLPETPVKVTLTRGADLDPSARFFSDGAGRKVVYCTAAAAPTLRRRLPDDVTLVPARPEPTVDGVSRHLAESGVKRLLVEGGRQVHTQFLAHGLADELQAVVGPFFVADSGAPRVVADGPLPWNRDRRARLVEVRPLGDVVLLRYALSARFDPDGPGGAT